jgi:hypothetical protein
VIEGKFGMSALLRSDIHRVRHAVGHGVAVLAKTHDVLDEKSAGPDRFAVVTVKTTRRIFHEGVRILSSFSYGRRQEEQEDQATEPDPLNSS